MSLGVGVGPTWRGPSNCSLRSSALTRTQEEGAVLNTDTCSAPCAASGSRITPHRQGGIGERPSPSPAQSLLVPNEAPWHCTPLNGLRNHQGKIKPCLV